MNSRILTVLTFSTAHHSKPHAAPGRLLPEFRNPKSPIRNSRQTVSGSLSAAIGCYRQKKSADGPRAEIGRQRTDNGKLSTDRHDPRPIKSRLIPSKKQSCDPVPPTQTPATPAGDSARSIEKVRLCRRGNLRCTFKHCQVTPLIQFPPPHSSPSGSCVLAFPRFGVLRACVLPRAKPQ